jgi:hypothetical protein
MIKVAARGNKLMSTVGQQPPAGVNGSNGPNGPHKHHHHKKPAEGQPGATRPLNVNLDGSPKS